VADNAKEQGCKGTLFTRYNVEAEWSVAAAIADDFASLIGQLKPVPKIQTPPFKGFCVGKSHNGYVGLRLVKCGDEGVLLEADILNCNGLLILDSCGTRLCTCVAGDAPFKDLLDANGSLKIDEAK
jgi:hypothetical protein